MGFRPLLPEEIGAATQKGTFRPLSQEEIPSPTVDILGSAWQGIKDLPSNTIQGIQSIPSGISSLYEALTSPIDSIKSGNTEKVLRTGGNIAAFTGGATAGGMAGAPLAPFTLGASVPIGAAIGGALGLFGYDKTNQLVGNDPISTLSEDVNKIAYNSAQALTGNVAAKGIGKSISLAGKAPIKLATKLIDKADELKERAVGIQYGDRVKSLGRAAMYVDDEGNLLPRDQLAEAVTVDAPIQQQVKLLDKKGILQDAPSEPSALKIHLEQNKNNIGLKIKDLIKEAHEASDTSKSFVPKFDKTREFINSYRGTVKAKLEKEFKGILNDYVKEQGGGFGKLARFTDKLQKETNFDQVTPKEITTLKRIAQFEFRKKAESIFDEVLPSQKGAFSESNSIYSAIESVNKTINKRLSKPNPSVFDYVKGGSLPAFMLGAPAAATMGLGPGAVVAGSALFGNALRKGAENRYPIGASQLYGRAGKALSSSSTPSNLINQLGEAIRSTSNITGAVGVLENENNIRKQNKERTQQRLPELSNKRSSLPLRQREQLLKERSSQGLNLDYSVTDTQNPQANPVSFSDANQAKEFVSQQHPLIQAVIGVESGGNMKARSKAGAYGPMQLMDGTAKDLGVNRYNPKENVKGGTQYLVQMLDQFKDTRLGLAAYNAGPGRVERAIKATRKAGEKVNWYTVSKRLPQETRDYVPKVINNYQRLIRA